MYVYDIYYNTIIATSTSEGNLCSCITNYAEHWPYSYAN